MPENGGTCRSGQSGTDRRRRLLEHSDRRWTLRLLATATEPLHVADLARDLVRYRPAGDGPAHGGPDALDVYLRLYHVHLPRLADADAITFDPVEKVASLTSQGVDLASGLRDQPDASPALSSPVR